MKRFFILGFAFGKSKAVLEMVNGAFHGSPDLIGITPCSSSAQSARVRPQVFFRIDVNHPAAGGRSTGMFTLTDAMVFPGGGILLPPDFWTDKFITDNAAAQSAGTFRFHWKGGIIGTAGDTVSIDSIIRVFQAGAGI